MSATKLFNQLRKSGLNPVELQHAWRSYQRAEADQKARNKQRYSKRWDVLLAPLQKQLQSMQGTQWRWSKDPDRAPVYKEYLALLLKVRDRIQRVRDSGPKETIPEIAAILKLEGDGMVWMQWVPAKVKQEVVLKFEHLHNVVLPDRAKGKQTNHATGKRIRPFTIPAHMTPSGVRWARLLGIITVRLEQFAENDDSPYPKALREALQRVHRHDPDNTNDVAPAIWTHLLTPETRLEYETWREVSVNGLREDGVTPEQLRQGQEGHLAALAAKVEKAEQDRKALNELKRAERRDYMREYMRRKRPGRQGSGTDGDLSAHAAPDAWDET